MKALDLFCGIGGLSLGFALTGVRCYGLDIDERAVETYNLNLVHLGCHADVQDVLEWEPRGTYDIVMAGSPCQPFSTANVSNVGEAHPLFPTFPRFFDVIMALRPRVFLLENVKGLLGRKFRGVLRDQLDRVADKYVTRCRVLDAAKYGVPQRRERLIIIGVRKDLGVKPSLPPETHALNSHVALDGRKISRWLTVRDAIDLVATNRIGSAHANGEKIVLPYTNYQRKHPPLGLDEPSRAITAHLAKTPRDALVLEMGAEGGRTFVLKGVRYRRLTVRDCLRLQSFPDWWKFPNGTPQSVRYALIGEAVPPILAYRLANHIGSLLNVETRPPRYEEWGLPYFRRAFSDLLGGE